MAVQAQHPSNILLLNRNEQEELDYSLQTQAGGGSILDQSQMLFNNGGDTNPRKRGREVAASGPINSFHMQVQPSQLIDLAKLHNQHQHHHPNVVSTGLRLSSGNQPQQQQTQNQHNFVSPSSSFFSFLSEDLSTHMKHQQNEFDQFFQAQGEHLRRTLAEKRQRHYRALLSAAEGTVARRLREKEAEIEKATRRNSELAARADQLSMEAQVWQAKARAQEATAASLQAQLQQAMMNGGAVNGPRVEDGGLASGGVEAQAEDAESAYIDPDRTMISGPGCKACRKRIASVVLIPCRHLCLCTECDQVVQACPICLTIRNSSVEVYLT